MNTYDVIVVGAGNGGLVAATEAAKAGYRTLLLEKHNLPGGCATSFVRGRFEFEPSLHELCSESSSPKLDGISTLFRDLGVDVPLVYEDTLFRAIVKGEDGYDVTLKAGKEPFLDSMEAAVPGCRESVKAFLDLIEPIDEAQIDMNENGLNPIRLFKDHADFLRVAAHSADEVMNALGVPEKAQHLLNTYWGYLGVPTDELNALHYLSMITCYIYGHPSMPHYRSHELSLALIKKFQEYGGEVRYNSEVTRFLYNGKHECIGVVAGGKVLYAKKIISNVIPNNVFNRSDDRHISPRSRKLANARKLGMSVSTVYLGLDCTMQELGVNDYSVFVMSDKVPRKQYENRRDFGMYIVNCLNKVLPDCTPEGTSTLFFTVPFFPGDLPADLTPQDYKKFKNALAEKYIRDYEKVMGISIVPHIEEISIATPVTFARYLGTPDGTIYGYATEDWDNIIARTAMKDADYDTANLYFCGGHYIRGDGYPSGYITGHMAATDVIQALKEGK